MHETPAFRMIDGTHGAACHFSGDAGFARNDVACAGVSA
jgi:hypothetical protein